MGLYVYLVSTPPMHRIICLFLVTAFQLSCSGDEPVKNDTFEYFDQRLNPNMKYNQLKTVFGQPANDIGSGIHIYVYDLNDGSRILIGYTDRILYARHVDEDNQVLHVII